MHRRKFIGQAAVAVAGVSLALSFSSVRSWYKSKYLSGGDLAAISPELDADFLSLVKWLGANGWAAYLEKVLGVNLTLTGEDLKNELVRKLDSVKLAALRADLNAGYDDFSGERLIQPGFPAYSLLFHTLASPRVRPAGLTQYPSLIQIDLLENYITAVCPFDELKDIYQVNSNEELVFAVFAYEYRPAFKTPHHEYADMVYSRTGIARIGDEPMCYDPLNRCYSNKPALPEHETRVAVLPARYGLFIARKTTKDSISLLAEKVHKTGDSYNDSADSTRTFLQPIRKVFSHDLLVRSTILSFMESHKSEKLKKLAGKVSILHNLKPKARNSTELIEQDSKKHSAGSSFLVISQAAPMIRTAREGNQVLFFKVLKETKVPYDNRYFTAFCTQEVEDVELLTGNNPLLRIANNYRSPRNQPLFVNITNKFETDSTYSVIPKTKTDEFEKFVNDGNYYAPLFEDSICDGQVTARTESFDLSALKGMPASCLPAFSVVTAPDFFPQVDPLDFEQFDIAPGLSKDSNFYEGGVASLATARIKPNPKMINTGADKTSDTYLAVLSGGTNKHHGVTDARLPVFSSPRSDKGYEPSGYLPDVASSVFAPGWDVTYCSTGTGAEIYIGTEGLGSPFIEDMKFCSALNGMWPATSPDASRTYQGSNEASYRNPTAVPLLDNEIGIYPEGPAGSVHACRGWDGEHGPFLEKIGTQWKINFTDLGRADAVTNALHQMLDMSKLRKLQSAELITRMDCLKRCIEALPKNNFNPCKYVRKTVGYTYLWLVSAEKVNWGKEDAAALGIPLNLAGTNKDWITKKENAKVDGEGYLYVFANSVPDSPDECENGKTAEERSKEWTSNLKRRRLDCVLPIYICQVTNSANAKIKIAWTEIKDDHPLNWKTA